MKMKTKQFLSKIIFYFENAPIKTYKGSDESFMSKVRAFLKEFKPQKIWKEKGILNKKLKINIYPDFILLLENKIIACEVEKQRLTDKFMSYNGMKLFDEIWFFTNIPVEKSHLHYKLENNLKIPQKFFGLNEKGEIVLIKEFTNSTV
jgi:hypothetical protein